MLLLFKLHSSTPTILSHSSDVFYLPRYETDPFLYYSIPGVREAEVSLQEVDFRKVVQAATKVSRNTRVSFECHTSVVMDELFGDELDGLGCHDEFDDLLTKLLYQNQQ